MTRFKCENGHVFVYAAKKTVGLDSDGAESSLSFQMGETKKDLPQLETHVCPFCHSLNFTEYTEPEADVEAVYVHDLTTGPQTALDGLLAQGWKITYRTSKQYILEKCKVEEVKHE